MNTYTLLLFLGFVTTGFTLSYVIAQKKKDELNKAFIYLAALIEIWLVSDMLVTLNFTDSEINIILRAFSFSWIFIGFVHLNFIYHLIKRKPDWFYYTVFFLAFVFTVLNMTTDLVLTGVTKASWGIIETRTSLYYVIILLLIIPIILGSILLLIKYNQIQEPVQKKQVFFVILGSVFCVISGTFFDVILPNVSNIMVSASFLSSLLSIFIYIAVTKYHLMSISMENVAFELFSQMPNGIILLDKNYEIIQINAFAVQLFGLPEKSLLNIPIQQLFNKLQIDHDFHNQEFTIINKDGLNKNLLLSSTSIKETHLEAGKIIIFQDITELKKISDNLIKSEERYREMALLLPTIIFETGHNLSITFLNQAGLDIFHFSEKDLESQPVLTDYICSEHKNRVLDYFTNIIQGISLGFIQFNIVSRDHEVTSLLCQASPIKNQSFITGIRWSAINIKPMMAAAMIPDVSFFTRYSFTVREKEVLLQLFQGYKTKEISKNLYIAESTVKTHISSIYQQMNVTSKTEFFDKLKGHHIHQFGYESFIISILSNLLRES